MNHSFRYLTAAAGLAFLSLSFSAPPAAASWPEVQGTVALESGPTSFQFTEAKLEKGLCQNTTDPIHIGGRSTPPRFNKPIINSGGGGGPGKVFFRFGPGDLGTWSSEMRSPVEPVMVCINHQTVELSCGTFDLQVRLDEGDQPEGAVIFNLADGAGGSEGSFSAAVPMRLVFDFQQTGGGRSGQAVVENTWLMDGSWTDEGPKGSTLPGQDLPVDADCDGVVDDWQPTSGAYLGVKQGPEGPQSSPFCGGDALGWTEFCLQPFLSY